MFDSRRLLLLQSGSHHGVPALHAPPQRLRVLCGVGAPGPGLHHLGVRRPRHGVRPVCCLVAAVGERVQMEKLLQETQDTCIR